MLTDCGARRSRGYLGRGSRRALVIGPCGDGRSRARTSAKAQRSDCQRGGVDVRRYGVGGVERRGHVAHPGRRNRDEVRHLVGRSDGHHGSRHDNHDGAYRSAPWRSAGDELHTGSRQRRQRPLSLRSTRKGQQEAFGREGNDRLQTRIRLRRHESLSLRSTRTGQEVALAAGRTAATPPRVAITRRSVPE
jgi:hypothetical protein